MFELIHKNQRRSIILVILLSAILIAVGWAAGELLVPGQGGITGILAATLAAAVSFLISYYSGDAVLLSASGAREIEKADAPQLFNVVEEMTIASGLSKMPRVFIIESTAPNAFATGRSPEKASVAITEGLLNTLNRDELQAVMAHEIAHVRHRDILFMTLLAVMAGAIAMVSEFAMRHFFWFGGGSRRSRSSDKGGGGAQVVLLLVALALVVLGALAARLVYFAASRTREYLADAGGAIYTRNPEALASALEKISAQAGMHAAPVPKVARGLLIVGASLFATHPPTEKRIAVLRALAGTGELSYANYQEAYAANVGGSAVVPPSAMDMAPVAPRTSRSSAKKTPFRREALNAVRKNSGYRQVDCACGAKHRIPPGFRKGKTFGCPHCGSAIEA